MSHDPLVELDRFLRIPAAIRDVVNTLEIHDVLLLSAARVHDTTSNLVAFDRLEQRLKIAFAKSLVLLALNEFEERRSHHVRRKDL